jgi:hypothetical protein
MGLYPCYVHSSGFFVSNFHNKSFLAGRGHAL